MKNMTEKQAAALIGKRVSGNWIIPDGYGVCALTGKLHPTRELEISFPHCNFTNKQLALLGEHGEGWVEDAEWLSEEGYEIIMERVKANGLMWVYYGDDEPDTAPVAPVMEIHGTVTGRVEAPAPVRKSLAINMDERLSLLEYAVLKCLLYPALKYHTFDIDLIARSIYVSPLEPTRRDIIKAVAHLGAIGLTGRNVLIGYTTGKHIFTKFFILNNQKERAAELLKRAEFKF